MRCPASAQMKITGLGSVPAAAVRRVGSAQGARAPSTPAVRRGKIDSPGGARQSTRPRRRAHKASLRAQGVRRRPAHRTSDRRSPVLNLPAAACYVPFVQSSGEGVPCLCRGLVAALVARRAARRPAPRCWAPSGAGSHQLAATGCAPRLRRVDGDAGRVGSGEVDDDDVRRRSGSRRSRRRKRIGRSAAKATRRRTPPRVVGSRLAERGSTDDWEPAVATDPSAPSYVYLLTTPIRDEPARAARAIARRRSSR